MLVRLLLEGDSDRWILIPFEFPDEVFWKTYLVFIFLEYLGMNILGGKTPFL